MNAAQKIVGCLLEDEGSWDFVSSVNDVDIVNDPPGWISTSVRISIGWHLDMDVREWGVKEFLPIIKTVNAVMDFDVIDDEHDQDRVETMEIKYDAASAPERPADNDPKANAQFYDAYTAEAQFSDRPEMKGTVYPTSVEIDIAKRHITVYFS